MTAGLPQNQDELRSILLDLRPAGPSGFEGLVASCLAAHTGLTFRLAKSGLQFGRDASTKPDAFAIAMEAKLYKGRITLEDVAGKAVVFDSAAGGEIDVWVLAATAEVGEGVVRDLHRILDHRGVELLTLDWSPEGLPALGVLLAAQRETVVRWFAANSSVDEARLEQGLAAIAESHGFAEQRDRLSAHMAAAHVGLGTLAAAADSWLRQRFRNRAVCQRTFSQFVNVADPEHPAQPREVPVSALAAAIRASGVDLVLVHGEEGAGKTWVVAQWWSALPDPPILLFVSGRRADLLDPYDPLEGLARILADQHPATNREGWKRRLARWRTDGAESTLRFVLVLDGVNERPRTDWADVIRIYVPLLRDLGGAVIATSRTAFWEREIAGRLRSSVNVKRVDVGGYSDLELAAELASAGAAVADLPPHVRDFVRNPRICSVAKYLLTNLAVQPAGLTIERVLLEYWRSRLAERGNLARHNIEEFDGLLRAHARDWLSQGRREFDTSSWATYSGAVRRKGLDSVLDDLTEIEEGRFLTITPRTASTYAFREDALPYALALLIEGELRDVTRRTNESPDDAADEAIARMLDPVRGFDRVSDIVAAAIGIAGWNEGTPVEVFQALIRGWCSLQNTTEASEASAPWHAATRPDALLDVAEQPGRALPAGFQSGTLIRLVVSARDKPGMDAALGRRIPRWLGSWSMEDDFLNRGGDADRRQAEREERIRSRLEELTEEERSWVRTLTLQLPAQPEIVLQQLSALLLARRPLGWCAQGLVGWALAQAIAGTVHNGAHELAWVIRLNRADPRESSEAVRRLVMEVGEASSPTARRAVGTVLRLLGDDDSQRRADELDPLQIGESWHVTQEFSDVDPHDPAAPPPADLSRARAAVQDIRPDQIWTAMGQTPEDMELRHATAPLARFEPETIVTAMRSIAATARTRSGIMLRQLAFRLPGLSAILDGDSLASVRGRLDSLLARPEEASPDDFHWILFNLTASLLPHMAAAEQIDQLQTLPGDMPPFVELGAGLTPASPSVLEMYLADALRNGDQRRLMWVLFHARYSRAEPTDRIRAEITRLFVTGTDLVGMTAASYVSCCRDQALDDQVIDVCLQSPCPDSWYHRRALADAVVRNSRLDAAPLVHPEFMGYVAGAAGGDALLLFRQYIDRAVSRALGRVEPTAWEGVELNLDASEHGIATIRWGDEQRGPELTEASGGFAIPERVRMEEERQERIRRAVETFQRMLADADAEYLAWPPSFAGLRKLALRDPDQIREWSERIVETTDMKRLQQVRNLGLAIASASSHADPPLAAAVFRKLASTRSVWNVAVDGLDLLMYSLFSASDSAEIDALRRASFEQAQDDKTIAYLVMAAERGAPGWLDRYEGGVDLRVDGWV